jgi:nicotinate-nucleotide adenylyltransferase
MNEDNFQPESPMLGVFGGTFDPPHLGHLVLAEEALYQLHLSQVLWVVTPNPPHKKSHAITEVNIRVELVQAAIQSNPAFLLSRVDVDRTEPHYAVDTLRLLQHSYPTAKLVYMIGGDSLHDLPKWHTPDRLLEACHLLGVMRRPGDQVVLGELISKLPALMDKLRWIDAPQLEIAASRIREKISQGEAYQYYLHPEVNKLIRTKRLYSEIHETLP